jgi:hypothetical protein
MINYLFVFREICMFTSGNPLISSNTVIHMAIAENNTQAAISAIEQDKMEEKSIINKESLGNTALLLALKKGNIKVALALLERDQIDVAAADSHGLTALHWACMLRQDAVITKLLDRGANPHLLTKSWATDLDEIMTPIYLYQRDVRIQYLYFYYLNDLRMSQIDPIECEDYACQTQFKNFFVPVADGKYLFATGFKDRRNLHIFGEMAYTDIIFHMDDLCTNLNWKDEQTQFKTTAEIPGSNVRFRENYKEGIRVFCKNRNNIPVNPELLSRMEQTKNLEELPLIDSAPVSSQPVLIPPTSMVEPVTSCSSSMFSTSVSNASVSRPSADEKDEVHAILDALAQLKAVGPEFPEFFHVLLIENGLLQHALAPRMQNVGLSKIWKGMSSEQKSTYVELFDCSGMTRSHPTYRN